MAVVKGPMLGTWASGTIGKSITFQDRIGINKFVVSSAYLVHGRWSEEQKRIRRIFGNRAHYWAKFYAANVGDD